MRAPFPYQIVIASLISLASAHSAAAQAERGVSANATPNESVVGMLSNFDDSTTKTSFGKGWVVSTDQRAGGKGFMPLSVDFVANAEWKEYTFPFTAFEGIDGHDVMGIAFTAGPTPGPFDLRIDEVSFK